ncbi:hypothetical protein Bca52824_033739 [Brassica carinata]|uniref:phosphoethanolamine N-methyltransferase n=1 Tax=Brassica carinata TaxID=52824 RepID=A0A8X7SF97_BRACI|nr:hypothetical protein Bca52824_033739 [Brassica carinata]
MVGSEWRRWIGEGLWGLGAEGAVLREENDEGMRRKRCSTVSTGSRDWEAERDIQKSYWMEHSSDLTVEAMMLDSKASDLDKEERPEVLSLIPPYEGKTVLELGAGIGRFTGELAQKAGEVIALDFIESAIKKNESVNGHYKNVKFMCADVTSPDLEIEDGSIDLIFSNWLLMYL